MINKDHLKEDLTNLIPPLELRKLTEEKFDSDYIFYITEDKITKDLILKGYNNDEIAELLDKIDRYVKLKYYGIKAENNIYYFIKEVKEILSKKFGIVLNRL